MPHSFTRIKSPNMINNAKKESIQLSNDGQRISEGLRGDAKDQWKKSKYFGRRRHPLQASVNIM